MDYNKIYENLILRRKQTPATGYTENHHIVMRSMGGVDSLENLVKLTGREHWIAHLLLHKIHRNSQTAFACHMMAMRCEERGIQYIRNSRTYEYIRKQHAKFIGAKNKISALGEGNSQYGTRWICNIELKENKKISKQENLPEGWILGRNKWKLYDIQSKKIKEKTVKQKREKLSKQIVITDGENVRRLVFVDQLPIPNGWYEGHRPCSDERKLKIKEKLSNKPRPYRVGLKYNKYKNT